MSGTLNASSRGAIVSRSSARSHRRRTLRPGDEGLGALAEFVVGNRDHRGERHSRDFEQHALDLLGEDVLAAADHHPVGAAVDEQFAAAVDMASVARDPVAVDQRALDGAVVEQVAGQQRFAADREPAVVADSNRGFAEWAAKAGAVHQAAWVVGARDHRCGFGAP